LAHPPPLPQALEYYDHAVDRQNLVLWFGFCTWRGEIAVRAEWSSLAAEQEVANCRPNPNPSTPPPPLANPPTGPQAQRGTIRELQEATSEQRGALLSPPPTCHCADPQPHRALPSLPAGAGLIATLQQTNREQSQALQVAETRLTTQEGELERRARGIKAAMQKLAQAEAVALTTRQDCEEFEAQVQWHTAEAARLAHLHAEETAQLRGEIALITAQAQHAAAAALEEAMAEQARFAGELEAIGGELRLSEAQGAAARAEAAGAQRESEALRRAVEEGEERISEWESRVEAEGARERARRRGAGVQRLRRVLRGIARERGRERVQAHSF
jgi:hypothetical protein